MRSYMSCDLDSIFHTKSWQDVVDKTQIYAFVKFSQLDVIVFRTIK